MNILIVGASGATGRLLTRDLLDRGHSVRVIVRSPGKLPEGLKSHNHITIIEGAVLALSDRQLAEHVVGCDAVASCLGHNLNFKGIYGRPRKLVTEATRRLCEAIRASSPDKNTKFVLMNTAGNSNRDLDEPISMTEKATIGLLRLLLPPHVDNEQAADYLRVTVGQNDPQIEWAVVRPDTLLNEAELSDYELHVSPIRSALFNPGKTSRINVAHFMADLITDESVWQRWQGQMPVIYNQ